MKELAAFYCPHCGYYAYYQTSRHAHCPKCGHSDEMHMVRMHYAEFMKMSGHERDDYLAKEIVKTNPSLVERLSQLHQSCNSREVIAEMNELIMKQNTEIETLNNTVKWMHDTIWELMREQKKISSPTE